MTPARPAHHDPGLLAVVFAGGCLGTATRAALEDAVLAAAHHWPWATLVINVTGALLLGLLLEGLLRVGADRGVRRVIRLGAGTGFLGGYTTYSTFMVETARLPWVLAVGYVVATTVLGLMAAVVGMRLARRWVGRRP